MKAAIVSWLKWMTGVFAAIAAILYFRSADKHKMQQSKLHEKARELEQDKDASIEQAIAVQKRAEAARLRSTAAVTEGKVIIDEIAQSNKPLADRVRAYNDRRAERLRKRKSS